MSKRGSKLSQGDPQVFALGVRLISKMAWEEDGLVGFIYVGHGPDVLKESHICADFLALPALPATPPSFGLVFIRCVHYKMDMHPARSQGPLNPRCVLKPGKTLNAGLKASPGTAVAPDYHRFLNATF